MFDKKNIIIKCFVVIVSISLVGFGHIDILAATTNLNAQNEIQNIDGLDYYLEDGKMITEIDGEKYQIIVPSNETSERVTDATQIALLNATLRIGPDTYDLANGPYLREVNITNGEYSTPTLLRTGKQMTVLKVITILNKTVTVNKEDRCI